MPNRLACILLTNRTTEIIPMVFFMAGSLDKSIRKATQLHKRGRSVKALAVLKELKDAYPQNPRLETRFNEIEGEIVRNVSGENPPQNVIDHLQALHKEKKFQLILKKCELLLKALPKSEFLWNATAAAQVEIKETQKGLISAKKALKIDPNYYGAHLNHSRALVDLGQLEDAISPLLKAVSLKPEKSEAYNNLGTIYEKLNRDDDAERCLKQALEVDPEFANAQHTLGIVKLKKHEFAEGWGLTNARFNTDFFDSRRVIGEEENEWNGEKVGTLFVWAEQGVGDEAMFASAFDSLLERCDKLVVSATNRMLPILFRSFDLPNIEFVPRENKNINFSFDAHAPIMSAVGRVRPTSSSFRGVRQSYLRPDPDRVATIKEELKAAAGGRKIYGISWFSLAKWYGKQRSIKLHKLVKCIPADAFIVSLQYGSAAGDITKLKRDHGIYVHQVDAVDNFVDLDGFMALIDACDHIVSIDNSTVHFAGAVGKPCDVLLPFSSSWRWGLNGTRSSYWFSSLRLHWQSVEGNWQPCLEELSQDLS